MWSATTARMAASLKSGAVFRSWRMARVAYMPLPIPRLIPLKMRKRLSTTLRHRSSITVMGIVAVIHVAVETMRPAVPGSCPKEYPADKPIRPIVPIGSTVIRRIVKVPIGTHRRHANVDGNLGRCSGHAAYQRKSES
jgi:hypothetical protein